MSSVLQKLTLRSRKRSSSRIVYRISKQPSLARLSDLRTKWETKTITPQVANQIITQCAVEIKGRGLDMTHVCKPFHMDADYKHIISLIRSYFDTPNEFTTDIKFANVPDVIGVVKWVLSHVRTSAERGLLDWSVYQQFQEKEKDLDYPKSAYVDHLTSQITSDVATLLDTLFDLLSSICAYSKSNGYTSTKLIKQFSIWLFSPEHNILLDFENGYSDWKKTSAAAEHVFLAYLRSQTSPLPIRLSELLNDYPKPSAPPSRTLSILQLVRSVNELSHNLLSDSLDWRVYPSPAANVWLSMKSSGVVDSITNNLLLRNALAQRRSRKTPTDRIKLNFHHPLHRSLIDKIWADFADSGFSQEFSTKNFLLIEPQQYPIGHCAGDRILDAENPIAPLRAERRLHGQPLRKALTFDLQESERLARRRKRSTIDWESFSTQGFKGRETIKKEDLEFAIPEEDEEDEEQEWENERDEDEDEDFVVVDAQMKKHMQYLRKIGLQHGDPARVRGYVKVDDVFIDTWLECIIEAGGRIGTWIVVEFKDGWTMLQEELSQQALMRAAAAAEALQAKAIRHPFFKKLSKVKHKKVLGLTPQNGGIHIKASPPNIYSSSLNANKRRSMAERRISRSLPASTSKSNFGALQMFMGKKSMTNKPRTDNNISGKSVTFSHSSTPLTKSQTIPPAKPHSEQSKDNKLEGSSMIEVIQDSKSSLSPVQPRKSSLEASQELTRTESRKSPLSSPVPLPSEFGSPIQSLRSTDFLTNLKQDDSRNQPEAFKKSLNVQPRVHSKEQINGEREMKGSSSPPPEKISLPPVKVSENKAVDHPLSPINNISTKKEKPKGFSGFVQSLMGNKKSKSSTGFNNGDGPLEAKSAGSGRLIGNVPPVSSSEQISRQRTGDDNDGTDYTGSFTSAQRSLSLDIPKPPLSPPPNSATPNEGDESMEKSQSKLGKSSQLSTRPKDDWLPQSPTKPSSSNFPSRSDSKRNHQANPKHPTLDKNHTRSALLRSPGFSLRLNEFPVPPVPEGKQDGMSSDSNGFIPASVSLDLSVIKPSQSQSQSRVQAKTMKPMPSPVENTVPGSSTKVSSIPWPSPESYNQKALPDIKSSLGDTVGNHSKLSTGSASIGSVGGTPSQSSQLSAGTNTPTNGRQSPLPPESDGNNFRRATSALKQRLNGTIVGANVEGVNTDSVRSKSIEAREEIKNKVPLPVSSRVAQLNGKKSIEETKHTIVTRAASPTPSSSSRNSMIPKPSIASLSNLNERGSKETSIEKQEKERLKREWKDRDKIKRRSGVVKYGIGDDEVKGQKTVNSGPVNAAKVMRSTASPMDKKTFYGVPTRSTRPSKMDQRGIEDYVSQMLN